MNAVEQSDHTLNGTKWISFNEMDEKEMIIHIEFTSDNMCVFIVEEKYDNGDHYIQPSPNCKYRAIAPHISFTEGKFFDFDMNFYKPVKGIYSESELEITLDNGSVLKFVPET